MDARLLEATWLKRAVLVTTDEGQFNVGARYNGLGRMIVTVNGQMAAERKTAPDVKLKVDVTTSFKIGSMGAQIEASLWPWGKYRSFRLLIGPYEIYSD